MKLHIDTEHPGRDLKRIYTQVKYQKREEWTTKTNNWRYQLSSRLNLWAVRINPPKTPGGDLDAMAFYGSRVQATPPKDMLDEFTINFMKGHTPMDCVRKDKKLVHVGRVNVDD